MREARGHDPGTRLRSSRHARDPKVGEHRLSVLRNEHVFRLDVAMQHPGVVSGSERVGELGADGHRLRPRDWPCCAQAVGERTAGRELHHDVRAPVGSRPRAVHRNDVGMRRERAHRLALAVESAARLVVERTREHLDGHRTAELWLPRAVDHCERAAADLTDVVEPGIAKIDRRSAHLRGTGVPRFRVVRHVILPRGAEGSRGGARAEARGRDLRTNALGGLADADG